MDESICFGNYGYDEGVCRFCWQHDRCSEHTLALNRAAYEENKTEFPPFGNL